MTKPLQDQIIMVTGASSGIGAATITTLLNAGARVVALARRVERLEQMQTALEAGSDRLLPRCCDICDAQQVEAAVKQALDWGGALHGLINNDGLSRGGLHETNQLEDLRVMLDTNVFALTNLTRLALPALKDSQGTLINISSTVVQALIPGSDRKSTRLNSSHVRISYAVFCLKKK